jgi:DNA polymerase III subunit chi
MPVAGELTEIDFHFNVPDLLGYACRLLRKAAGTGAKVMVTGSTEVLRQLDADLWTFSAVEFLPHCLLRGDERVIAASPIVLATTLQTAPHREVLLNLGQSVPDGFEDFQRVVEIVTVDEESRQWARQRWKHYSDLNHVIRRHDLSASGSR